MSFSYGSKNTPLGQKDAEEIAKSVFLYLLRIAFPALEKVRESAIESTITV